MTDDKTPHDGEHDDAELPKAPDDDFADLTPEQHENVEWDVNTTMESIAARPAVATLGVMVAEIVEDAFSKAKRGLRVPSCLHAVDQSYMPGIGYLPIGEGQESEREIFLCTQHPERLMCDNPASSTGPGCFDHHVNSQHQHEAEAVCFVCDEPIPEDQVTPVFAVIKLKTPLQVYDMYDRAFVYQGDIMTLPITYLCIEHIGAAPNLPFIVEWHLVKPQAA